MGYINKVKIVEGQSQLQHLIEPTLFAVTGGSGTNITASIDNFELVNGVIITLQIGGTYSTNDNYNIKLTINNGSSKDIYYENAPITANILKQGYIYNLVYDATNDGKWYVLGDNISNGSTANGIAYYSNALGKLASTSAGTDGQVLISKGGSAAPVWYDKLTLATNNNVGEATFNGNIIPYNNNDTLGKAKSPASSETDNGQRWGGVYIGTADSYGDVYTPIYWDNGVPTVAMPIQRINFTFDKTHNSLTFQGDAITSNTQVLEIVVTGGLQWMHSPITWENTTDNQEKRILELTVTSAMESSDIPNDQRTITGYILIAHIPTLTFNN